MKKFVFFLIFAFAASLFNAQTIDREIINNNEVFTGKIENSATINVSFKSVTVENKALEIYKVSGCSDVEGSKADFEGTITLNPEKTKKAADKLVKIYDLKLFEKGTDKHNGIFTGELKVKNLSEKNQLRFEGSWENYGNTLKFPFYFNN